MDKNLTEKSLLVSLHITTWSGRKIDHQVNREVEQQHNAKDAGNYNKVLIDKEKMRPYQQILQEARKFHLEQTLPWGDDGPRLLPTENFLPYATWVGNKETEFFKETKIFRDNYTQYVQDSAIRLGTLFKGKEYPTVEQIEAKFNFRASYMPVPSSDFRVVNIGEADMEALRASVGRELSERLKGATDDLKARIKKHLQLMKERLSDPAARIYDSLFENLKELSDVVPRLNITGDKEINDICAEMRGLVIDPDLIREDKDLRKQKAQELDSLVRRYSDFFN